MGLKILNRHIFTLLAFIFVIPFAAMASHSVGADLSFSYVSPNTYQISLNFYRDCAGISAPNPATISISSASCGQYFTVDLYQQSFQQVNLICQNQQNQTTCQGGNLPGIEQYTYTGTVVLPAQCSDWVIGYNLCCRNAAITNLSNPGSQNIYIEAHLNNTNGLQDNSPVFTSLPTPYICAGVPTFYNHGAVDIDGDSLVFTLINPLTGPGSNIPYVNGTLYPTKPLNVTGPFNFSSSTGQLSFTATGTQNAVLDVLVSEYRNGVLIGSVMRDIQVVVLPCSNNPPTMTGINGTSSSVASNFIAHTCVGNPLCFTINFSDPDVGQIVTAAWNNGIPGGTFTVTGTNPPVATFCWTPTVADIGNNLFSVTAQDNACPIIGRDIQAFTVIVTPASYQLNMSHTDVSCFGGNNGTASVSAPGAVPPITYLWSNAATTQSISGLVAGTYKVTVNDASSCGSVDSVVITQPAAIVAAMSETNATCLGANNGTATVAASGGTSASGNYTYLWSVPPPNTVSTITGLASGWFYVTVTDDVGCTTKDSVFVFQPAPVVISPVLAITSNYNGAAISCFGKTDGQITANITGGTAPYSLQWSPNANGQTTAVINNIGKGTYSLTVTDAQGCNAGAVKVITDPPKVIASSLINTSFNGYDISCFGANNGKATAGGVGGTGAYTYQWNALSGNQTSVSAINLGPGQYVVTVTDANGCTDTSSVTLTEPPLLTVATAVISNYHGSDITCFGASDGRAKAIPAGGDPGYKYKWNDPAQQSTPIAYGLAAGTYNVVITDTNGCTTNQNVILNQPPKLTAVANITSLFNGYNVRCYGDSNGTATVLAGGGIPGYKYVWNTIPIQNTINATGLKANIKIIITVTDTNECNAKDSVTLIQPPKLKALATVTSNYHGRQISCHNGSDGVAVASGQGGVTPYTYQWDPNSGGVLTAIAGTLKAGTYTVTLTDANQCIADTFTTLVDPPALTSNAVATTNYNGYPIKCFGDSNGAVLASAQGGTAGYTYLWDNNAGSSIFPSVTSLKIGIYNVTVTDVNNCTTTTSVQLNQPAQVTAKADSVSITCFGLSDGVVNGVANGGVPGYTYNWGTQPAQTTSSATGLLAGTYALTVVDLNNCSTTTQTTVVEPPKLLSITGKVDPICYHGKDGKVYVGASGGVGNYTYQWSTSPVQTTDTARGVFAGNYSVTITDGNGCLKTDTVSIVEPPSVTVTVTPAIDSLIFGKSVTLNSKYTTNASGLPTYSWSPSDGLSCTDCAQPIASPLSTTDYTLIFTDSNGCTATAKSTLIVGLDRPLYVPNAFTPNNDNVNDIFYVYASGVKEIDLKVFDRWGSKVFESHDITVGWNGTFKGTLLDPAVFVYYVDVIYLDGTEKTAKGSVTLLR